MDVVGGQQENNDNGPIMSTMNDSSELLTTDHYDDGNQEIHDNNHDIPSFIDTMATNIASAASSAAASASVARNQQSHRRANGDDGDDDISSVTGTIMRHNHPTDEDMEDVKERYRRQLASRMYQDEAVHRQQSSLQQQQQEQPTNPPATPPNIPIDEMLPPPPSISSSPASANSGNQATPQHYKRQLLKQQHQQQSSYVPPTSVSPTPVAQGDTENNTSTTTTDSQTPATEEHRHQSRRALESLPTAELVVEEEHEDDEPQDIEGGAVAPSMMSQTKAQLKSLHTSVSLTDSQRSEPSSSSPPAVAAAVVEIAIEETTRADKKKNASDSETRNRNNRMVYIFMALVSLLLLLGVVMGTLVATGSFEPPSSSSSLSGDDGSNMEKTMPHQDDINSEAAIPTSPTMTPTTGKTSILEQTDPKSIEWEQMGGDINSLGGGVTAQQFGKSVAMSSDGIVIAIGAPDSNFATGHVQIHEWDEQEKMWTVRGSILTGNNVGDRFGYSVSMNDDATILAIGAIGYQNNVGYVQIFQWSSTNEDWIPMIVKGEDEETPMQGMFVGNADLPNSFFGRSISFNSDGTVLAIGASAFMLSVDGGSINNNDDGYIRVFHYDEIEQKWIQRGNELIGGVAGERTPEQNIGTTVSLSDDGTKCLTGTPTFLDTVGASIVFQYDPLTSESNSNYDWDRTLVVKAEWGYDLGLKDYAGVTGAISGDGQYICAGSMAGFIRIGRYVPSRGTYVMDWGDFYGIDDVGNPILSQSNSTVVVSGESLSMTQISDNHMVVAWGVYTDADVDNGGISSTTPGRVTMYSYRPGPEETLSGTWKEVGSPSILYGNEVGDQFGSSIALSKDEATLVVGASQGNYVKVFRATTT